VSLNPGHDVILLGGFAGCAVTYVDSEKLLFEQLSRTLQLWDPDILVGYEPQQLSWGYLIDRARLAHNMDLCATLSRTPESVCYYSERGVLPWDLA
jgi:DNA polymerase elongation subunit (family B)